MLLSALFKHLDDINNSRSCGQGYRCYEHIRVIDDMNDFGHELKKINAMNNSDLWMTWTILGHELRALDATNSLRS